MGNVEELYLDNRYDTDQGKRAVKLLLYRTQKEYEDANINVIRDQIQK